MAEDELLKPESSEKNLFTYTVAKFDPYSPISVGGAGRARVRVFYCVLQITYFNIGKFDL